MQAYNSVRSKLIISKEFIYFLLSSVFLLIAVALVSSYLEIPVSIFTRDPMAVASGHPFFGFVSNIGVILWSASVTVSFFAYILLKTNNAPQNTIQFVASGGALSLILLFDDLFMLHDRIFPMYFGLGEKLIFLVYGLFFLAYIIVFFKKIINTNFVYLTLSVFFFSLSIVVDILPESLLPMHHLFEDGAKLLGIVSWLSYHFSVAYNETQLGRTSPTTE